MRKAKVWFIGTRKGGGSGERWGRRGHWGGRRGDQGVGVEDWSAGCRDIANYCIKLSTSPAIINVKRRGLKWVFFFSKQGGRSLCHWWQILSGAIIFQSSEQDTNNLSRKPTTVSTSASSFPSQFPTAFSISNTSVAAFLSRSSWFSTSLNTLQETRKVVCVANCVGTKTCERNHDDAQNNFGHPVKCKMRYIVKYLGSINVRCTEISCIQVKIQLKLQCSVNYFSQWYPTAGYWENLL